MPIKGEKPKMKFETFKRLEEIRKRRRRHLVILAGIITSISIIAFGAEMLGLATGVGVVGTIFFTLSDL